MVLKSKEFSWFAYSTLNYQIDDRRRVYQQLFVLVNNMKCKVNAVEAYVIRIIDFLQSLFSVEVLS